MLPEVLIKLRLLSLRPNEEKFTFSAVFKINDKAEVLDQWFGRTVTYSDARFAYEEAQFIIENRQAMHRQEKLSSNLVPIPETISITGKPYPVKNRNF